METVPLVFEFASGGRAVGYRRYDALRSCIMDWREIIT